MKNAELTRLLEALREEMALKLRELETKYGQRIADLEANITPSRSSGTRRRMKKKKNEAEDSEVSEDPPFQVQQCEISPLAQYIHDCAFYKSTTHFLQKLIKDNCFLADHVSRVPDALLVKAMN